MTTMSATAGIFIIKCTRWRIIDVPTIGPFPIFSNFRLIFSLAALPLIPAWVYSLTLRYSRGIFLSWVIMNIYGVSLSVLRFAFVSK